MIVELDWDNIPKEKSYDLRRFAEKYSDENTYQIFIIGDNSVGKTAYLNNIISESFKHLPTIHEGITLSLLVSGKELIQIWEIPYEEDIFETIGYSMKEMDGVLAMFDLTNRDSFDRVIDQIGHIIRVYGKMYPLYLVGNKAEMKHTITKEDILVYAYELGNCSCHRIPYAEISSLHNIGIDQIIDNLLTISNCNMMSKCSNFPTQIRNWCKVPQYHSFQKEPRQKLEIID